MAGDVARGRGGREALEHAAECVECAARLASERAVTEALAALAGSAEGRGAPERVEAALVEAFARRGEGVRRARAGWKFGLAVAAALAGMVVGVAAWMRDSRVAETPHPVAKQAPPVAAVVEVPRQVAPRPARLRPRVRTNGMKRTAAPVREVATQYFPLRYGDSGAEAARGPVLRVQVPRVTLVSFGLPMDQDRADEPVEADVALDETGFARAIRFVREQ
jgi:hypothetical protein